MGSIKEKGQGLGEYLLILFLVAIVVIAMMLLLGTLLQPASTMVGSVISHTAVCPSDSIVSKVVNGEQKVTCQGNPDTYILVDFGGAKGFLWTDTTSTFQDGNSYVFSFNNSGYISQYYLSK